MPGTRYSCYWKEISCRFNKAPPLKLRLIGTKVVCLKLNEKRRDKNVKLTPDIPIAMK